MPLSRSGRTLCRMRHTMALLACSCRLFFGYPCQPCNGSDPRSWVVPGDLDARGLCLGELEAASVEIGQKSFTSRLSVFGPGVHSKSGNLLPVRLEWPEIQCCEVNEVFSEENTLCLRSTHGPPFERSLEYTAMLRCSHVKRSFALLPWCP